MNSLAPLQLPTILAYSGLVIALCGVQSVFARPAGLGFSSRTHGLLAGILVGAALLTAGWFWPVQPITIRSPSSRLDLTK